MPVSKQPRDRYYFGIGEWYGLLFNQMSPEKRKLFAEIQLLPRNKRNILCPYFPPEERRLCSKVNGVCSARRYIEYSISKQVEVVKDKTGGLRIVCPNRFRENGYIYRIVGKEILGIDNPLIINEVGFLTSKVNDEFEVAGDDVGRIDQILLNSDLLSLDWCALEVQAVYLSGPTIANDFNAIRNYIGEGFSFPTGNHRPDYRSSGPKRLMPQLQIKVPTLRRWGKKMAVVVDKDFFAAMASMETVDDISNCDIVWFVMEVEEPNNSDTAHLIRHKVAYTTLERAVEGLTAGVPVSKKEFEIRIIEKLNQQRKNRLS